MKVALMIVSSYIAIVVSQESRQSHSPSLVVINGAPRSAAYSSPVNEDSDSNFEYAYEVQDAQTGNNFGHKSSQQGKIATGNYHIVLPDGRLQTVNYVADENGYKPNVKFEGQAGTNALKYKYDATTNKY